MTTFKIDGRKSYQSFTNDKGIRILVVKQDKGVFFTDCKTDSSFNTGDTTKQEVETMLNKFMNGEPVASEPVASEPVASEPVAAEPKKDNTMLSINQILKTKPVFILSVDYNAGSLADMTGEYNRDDNSDNEYLAEMVIQYHSLADNACLAFYVECLVSVNDDNIVTIEEMNTSPDNQSVYAHNIDGLFDGHVTIGEYGCIDIDYHDMLQELIEEQPIYDIPEHFIIESY